MINDEFVEEFIREVEMELASLAPVEKAVEDALDSMKSEIDPNVKIDESMLDSVKQKAKAREEFLSLRISLRIWKCQSILQ